MKVHAAGVAGGLEIDDIVVVAGQGAAIADLTHAFGTADGTVEDVTGSFSQTVLNNNFKELTTKINLILARMRASTPSIAT